MTEPFDRSLPSPIADVLQLQARSEGAVVSDSGVTALQRRSFVSSSLEERVLDAAASGEHDLIVVTGSAGGGKSALLAHLVEEHRDDFGDVVLDATHADRPDLSQAQQLESFLAPFADDAPPRPPGPPALLAANTGMILELFRQLHADGARRFTALEGVLKHRLGVGDLPEPDADFSVLVVNLDLRPTAGPDGLASEMLARLDFDAPEGVIDARRCATCNVLDWCPVRTNAAIASGPGREAIDRLLRQAAMSRGRHDAPRQLWDFFARIVTGDPFATESDPCERVARAAREEDRRWVWERLLPNTLVSREGELGRRVGALDPSLQPSRRGHELVSSAGIDLAQSAGIFDSLASPAAPAVTRGTELIREAGGDLDDLGRTLITCEFITDPEPWPVGSDVAARFELVLADYQRWNSGTSEGLAQLSDLKRLLERALARAFGLDHQGRGWIPVKSYDPRDPSRVFAPLDLDAPGQYSPRTDPPVAADSAGARLTGHRPLAVTIRLASDPAGDGGVDVAVTLPMFELLHHASAGTLASTADLERFFALRRAVEALARRAASGREMLVERPNTHRRYVVSQSQELGGRAYRAREVTP